MYYERNVLHVSKVNVFIMQNGSFLNGYGIIDLYILLNRFIKANILHRNQKKLALSSCSLFQAAGSRPYSPLASGGGKYKCSTFKY